MSQPLTLRATSTNSSVPSLLSPSPSPSPSPNKKADVSSQGQADGDGNGHVQGQGQGLKGVDIPPHGLLVPTDRSREELEQRWIHHLGRYRVHSEVVLPGYSLYSLRSWYLSRTHWAQTIVTSTGPRDHITAYLLIPDPSLSERAAKQELETAVRYLSHESNGSQQRKTEFGILLINKAQNFGQDVSPIPGGDLREAKPYMIVNTGLRRLGCGARAALGIDPPVPALRRKFHELYRLPQPPHSQVRASSPPTSPRSPLANTPTSPRSGAAVDPRHDPFSMMVVEVVKLVQAALALWGLFGADRDDLDINGLFCDETKAGIFKWRHLMGMEKETLRLEKETSGGCIDPKTLAALLSSITSVTYELRVLGVSTLPKDPFRSVKRFLAAWRRATEDVAELKESKFLDVHSIRTLNKAYLARRSKYPSDWFSVHHSVLSGVAHATSSLSANLKGTMAEDGPLRRREHRPDFDTPSTPITGRFNGNGDGIPHDQQQQTGLHLIVPDDEVGHSAAPDIITTNLEAYTSGIKRSKEKDWVEMGARRIGDLWKGGGNFFEGEAKRGLGLGLLSRKNTVKGDGTEDDSDDGGRTRGALARTGQAFKGLVGRKGSVAETSDSEAGGGLIQHLARRKQSTVPTLIEPDLEEVDEHLDERDRFSPSPSPSGGQVHRLDIPPAPASQSYSSRSNRSKSNQRPSIITNLSNGSYDLPPFHTPSHHHPSNSTTTTRYTNATVGNSGSGNGNDNSEASTSTARFGHGLNRGASAAERAVLWRERGMATRLLRSSSTGADVAVDEGGMEWEVLEPHGTGRGQPGHAHKFPLGRRTHSQEDIKAYRFTRVEKPEHLAVDIEMCAVVAELRAREKQLAQKNREMKALAASIQSASLAMSTTTTHRQSYVTRTLQTQVEDLEIRFAESIDLVTDIVARKSEPLGYKLAERSEEEWMYDRMRTLEGQYRDVLERRERA